MLCFAVILSTMLDKDLLLCCHAILIYNGADIKAPRLSLVFTS
jgi:hypothetical protein